MIFIARPRKCRRVEFIPESRHFAPVGREDYHTDEIVLKVEEVEAMRLKDIEKLSQEDCAKKMEVSRQTFQNIIGDAREKVVRALIEGKAIIIKGGNYELEMNRYRCKRCRKNFSSVQEKENFCLRKCEIKRTEGENTDE